MNELGDLFYYNRMDLIRAGPLYWIHTIKQVFNLISWYLSSFDVSHFSGTWTQGMFSSSSLVNKLLKMLLINWPSENQFQLSLSLHQSSYGVWRFFNTIFRLGFTYFQKFSQLLFADLGILFFFLLSISLNDLNFFSLYSIQCIS